MNQKDLNESFGCELLFLLNVFGTLEPRRQQLRIVCFMPHFQSLVDPAGTLNPNNQFFFLLHHFIPLLCADYVWQIAFDNVTVTAYDSPAKVARSQVNKDKQFYVHDSLLWWWRVHFIFVYRERNMSSSAHVIHHIRRRSAFTSLRATGFPAPEICYCKTKKLLRRVSQFKSEPRLTFPQCFEALSSLVTMFHTNSRENNTFSHKLVALFIMLKGCFSFRFSNLK